ncbi:MAG TPA: hypothetical protein VJY39_15455 [Acidisphaera sp.]|nr:hypothetical protein [Acidisphaera sp.]
MRRHTGRRRVGRLVLLATLAFAAIAPARAADAGPPSASPSDARVIALAMHWLTEIQAGRSNPSLYTPFYRTQVDASAIRRMSRLLAAFGPPLRAEIVTTRSFRDQTIYLIKFVFAHGDTTGLIIGLDDAGKITGIIQGPLDGGPHQG